MNINNQEIISRLKKYQALIQTKNLRSILLTSPAQIQYATNFMHLYKEGREAIAVIRNDGAFLLVPAMHQGQIKTVFHDVNVIIVPPSDPFWHKVTEVAGGGKVGFEAADLRYLEFAYVKKELKSLVPIGEGIEQVRMVKSEAEIGMITQAEKITEQTLEKIIKKVKLGDTELEIARELDIAMEELGADGVAFPTIVAFGKNSANPHYIPGRVKLQQNQVILIDMGASKDGYNGDLTRTYFIGEPDETFVNAYNLVAKAQLQALKKIKPGIAVKTIDQAARKTYEKAGELEHFLHTTGHGLGIDVHEAPSIAWTMNDKLQPGMVFTVEPGLYYPEWGGVRIEDVVTVTEEGFKLLSTLDRNLKILPVKR